MNYSDLMKEVSKKSIPMVLNSPDEFRVFYTGSNGKASQFKEVVKESLKDGYEMDENRFIKYKEYPVGEYRNESSDGEYLNVYSKWHLVTNEINNNPFSYSFLPTDLIILNYSKSTDPVFMAKNVVNSFCETKKKTVLKGEGLVPLKTRKLKLIISSLTSLEPYLTESLFKKSTCDFQRRRCYVGDVTYKKTEVAFKGVPLVSTDSRFLGFLENTILEIDGFEYPLSKLIKEGRFSLSVDQEGKIIIDSNESFIKSLKGFGTETLRFSVFHRRAQKQIEVGSYLVRCDCGARCGGPAVLVGCDAVRDFGSAAREPVYLDYSFYTSVFIF